MRNLLKSMVVGYEVPSWGPQPDDQDNTYQNLISNIIRVYPDFYVLTSSIKYSTLRKNKALIYELTYLYDSDIIDNVTMEESMNKFKEKVEELIESYLNIKGIHYSKLSI